MVETSKVLVIRFAGEAGLSPKKLQTLEYLGLKRKHWAAVIDDTPSYRGMLAAVEREVVWGPLDDEAVSLICERAKLPQEQVEKIKSGELSLLPKLVRLHPPKKGYKEYSWRRGNIGADITPLLKRMA
ncbi:uL30 family ribosomal protein [Tardisphaera miroshnichenkoae]